MYSEDALHFSVSNETCSTVSSTWEIPRFVLALWRTTSGNPIWTGKKQKIITELDCCIAGIKLVLRMILDLLRNSIKQCFWFGLEIKVKVKNKWCYLASPTLRRISDPRPRIISGKACAFFPYVASHTDSRKVKIQNCNGIFMSTPQLFNRKKWNFTMSVVGF